jgi:hypothetical protein
MTGTSETEPRFEVKFVASPEQYAGLVHWVRMHGAGFGEPYPPRFVNNVYFDSPSMGAYSENLFGVSRRSKVRLRWYGETWLPERATLEVKRRRGRLGWKESYPLPAIPLAGTPWSEIRRRIRSELPPRGRLVFDAASLPVLINRYRRRYFVSRDERVRLTIDRDQQVIDQRRRQEPVFDRRSNLPDTIVVELKFASEDRELASRAIEGLPVRVSRNSKYVIGVLSLLNG